MNGYIVGKGPSLLNLRPEHFGEGPIATINEAIVVVDAMELDNDIYSLQKDGCDWIHTFPNARCETRDEKCPLCIGRESYPMVYPSKSVTVVVFEGESHHCLSAHPKRIVTSTSELGLTDPSTMSLVCAAHLLAGLGCDHLVIMCCDSLATDDSRTVQPLDRRTVDTYAGLLLAAKQGILTALSAFSHEFVVPC